jgi:hypothetical protein
VSYAFFSKNNVCHNGGTIFTNQSTKRQRRIVLYRNRKMKMRAILMSAMMAFRKSLAFVVPSQTRPTSATRLFSISKNAISVQSGVSRMETLQALLLKHGAPGSKGCTEGDDLEPVIKYDTPELISSITGMDGYSNLHPHLYPIAKSKKTGNIICALRRAFSEDAMASYESSSKSPWPIVEAQLGGVGMRLLALNSEHLMRRIVCECDFSGQGKELITAYNNGLDKSSIKDAAMGSPYEIGAVKKLG